MGVDNGCLACHIKGAATINPKQMTARVPNKIEEKFYCPEEKIQLIMNDSWGEMLSYYM